MTELSKEEELDKALWKAWDELDPECTFNYETGEQELHTEGKESLFHYDDVEEIFIAAFHAGADYERNLK